MKLVFFIYFFLKDYEEHKEDTNVCEPCLISVLSRGQHSASNMCLWSPLRTTADQMSANSNDANRLSDGVATATILPLSTKRTGPPGLGHEGEDRLLVCLLYMRHFVIILTLCVFVNYFFFLG